jgi:DNA-directed RNA polymerase subunit RPC12/RpoP
MEYKCNICVKIYSSYQSLWIHNKKFHNNNNINDDIDNPNHNQNDNLNDYGKSYKCNKCNKEFSHYQNRWRHEKICTTTKKVENEELKKELLEMKNMVTKLLNERKTVSKSSVVHNNNTNNGTINNKTINNNIFICPPGEEKIALTNEEMNDILKEKINPITKLVKYTNFDKNRPENHSFCTNNLNGPHLLTYDNETKQIVVSRKKHFYDKLISNEIKQFEIILHSKKLSSKQTENIKYTIGRLKELQALPNDKIFKSLLKEFNMISYNHKNIVKKTWKNMGLFDKESQPEDIMDDDIFIKNDSESDDSDIEV